MSDNGINLLVRYESGKKRGVEQTLDWLNKFEESEQIKQADQKFLEKCIIFLTPDIYFKLYAISAYMTSELSVIEEEKTALQQNTLYEQTHLRLIYFALLILEKKFDNKKPELTGGVAIEAYLEELRMYFIAAFAIATKVVLADERYQIRYIFGILREYMGLDEKKLSAIEREILNDIEHAVPLDYLPPKDQRSPYSDYYEIMAMNDLDKQLDALRTCVAGKASSVAASLSAPFEQKILTHAQQLDALKKEYKKYLIRKQKQNGSINKKISEKIKAVSRISNDFSKTDFLTAKDLAEISQRRGLLSSPLFCFCACISIVPGLILAIHSYYFSSKKTAQFWKSHGEIFVEKITALNARARAVSDLIKEDSRDTSVVTTPVNSHHSRGGPMGG